MKRPIVVFASGRGSNLEALLKASPESEYVVSTVVSDKAGSGALSLAQSYGVPQVICCPRENYSSREEQKKAIYDTLNNSGWTYLCLAGFMQIVPAAIVEKFKGRIINIHPSLLPKFPGLNTHARALESKESHHGCTVHFVDAGVDTGAVIAQAKVAVALEDTEETLAARVLAMEHKLYPRAVNALIKGHICLKDNVVTYDSEWASIAEKEGFILPAASV